MSAVRYPVQVQQMARQLYEAGWNRTDVRRIMRRQGVDPLPAFGTITLWVDPIMGERRRVRSRQHTRKWRQRSHLYRFPGRDKSPEWLLGRMRSLAAADLSPVAITKVMAHDFPDLGLTRDQVYEAISNGRVPLPLQRMAT